MIRLSVGLLALSVVSLLGLVGCVAFQQADESARAKAERDYHGDDRTGKDGPLRAADLDLLLLYHRYQEAKDKDAFSPAQPQMRVSEGDVTVEAVAADEVEALRSDLEQLGMTNTATAGQVVSGRLPIEQIPDAAQLETLRSLMPSHARTRNSQ